MPSRDSAAEPLLELVRAEIRAGGPMHFERFMELALYDPRHGYYTGGREPFGPEGDFFTAADVGREFGRCMARQIRELDSWCGPFDPCRIIECGAGRGLLARDLLDALTEAGPADAGRYRYTMVERSPALRERARVTVPEAGVADPAGMTGGGQGFVLAVELFDALPVRRVRRQGAQLLEIAVDLDASGALVECERAAEPEVAVWAERYGAAAEDGAEAEVSLQLAGEMRRLATLLERGFWILVDYGEEAPRLYRRRPHGTLLAYRRHTTGNDLLAHVGRQDLTAHVNFSALADAARECGLAVLGLTTQDRFLIGNGLLELFESGAGCSSYHDPRQVKRRLQAKQLLHPLGMGRAFRVLILGRGCALPATPSGLRDPFARE